MNKRAKRIARYAAIVACVAVLAVAATASTANSVQNGAGSFYLRYLPPEDMAVADAAAERYGARVYFDALQSDDLLDQYFAINKLVEYYDDEETRSAAVEAITPFLANADERLADAAAFALSVLRGTFDDPRILRMADGTVVFALFNDYSDYGTYNEIWAIEDGVLRKYAAFDRPKMYIRRMIPSPDGRLLAVSFVSNKSGYLTILEVESGIWSPELVDSARVMAARDLGIDYWQRMDNENYCGEPTAEWVHDAVLEFRAALWYPGAGGDDALVMHDALIRYDFAEKRMDYTVHEGGN